jgi:hypothetical protein
MSKIIMRVSAYAVLEHDQLSERELALIGKDRLREIESDLRNKIKTDPFELRFPNGGVVKYGFLVGQEAVIKRVTPKFSFHIKRNV